MNKIEQFKNELIKRVQERDENAYVTISQDMIQAMAGEYTATIHLTGGKKSGMLLIRKVVNGLLFIIFEEGL